MQAKKELPSVYPTDPPNDQVSAYLWCLLVILEQFLCDITYSTYRIIFFFQFLSQCLHHFHKNSEKFSDARVMYWRQFESKNLILL